MQKDKQYIWAILIKYNEYLIEHGYVDYDILYEGNPEKEFLDIFMQRAATDGRRR